MFNTNTTKLRNSYLDVVFNLQTGLPETFKLIAEDSLFCGAKPYETIEAKICKLMPRGYIRVPVVPKSVRKGMSCITFLFEANYGEIPAASFELRYLLGKYSITVKLEEVKEYEGFEFIEASIPCLVSIDDSSSEDAWLAHCNSAGHIVKLKDAKCGELPENPYFGKIMHILPVVMLGTTKAVCVMEITAFNDGTELKVEKRENVKRAVIGTVKTHRVDGSSWCNSNDDNLTLIYGNENTPNLIVGQKSSCRLDFVGDYDRNGRVDWLDGAKVIHSRMPKLRNDYYDDKIVYRIGCDLPGLDKPNYTFAEVAQLVKNVASLIDYNPQIVYIGGWSFEGRDTGYPAVNILGHRLGGYDAYLKMKEDAEKVNCNISLDDNYDDAYDTSPEWEPKYIARLPDGTLWKSRNWTRDPSYILGLAKYMEGPGVNRVHYTCKRYKLYETTHIDVLSWFAIRNDWDHANPASGIRNLYEGRFKVLDEFSKQGIDVTSESLRYPMVGRLSMSSNEVLFTDCPFGGKQVPILPGIYKNAIIYGGSEDDSTAMRLLYNIHSMQPHGFDEIIDQFYLRDLPWFKLHKLEVIDYKDNGKNEIIILEDNSMVSINSKTNDYFALWNGAEITRNNSVCCPIDDERIAFYSLEENILQYPIPKEWEGKEIKAHALYADHTEEYPFVLEDNTIWVKVRQRRPVIVYIER
jgi:hypothetical protein